MSASTNIIALFEDLTGHSVPFQKQKDLFSDDDLFAKGGVGYSQFNEILLTLGYDRITRDFFDYLFSNTSNRTVSPVHYPQVSTIGELQAGIEKFQIHSLLLFGNVKYGFKTLSRLSKKQLEDELCKVLPIPKEVYEQRHKPLHSLTDIRPEDTYYLGYVVYGEVKRRLEQTPSDLSLKKLQDDIEITRLQGRRNHDVYLTYDHMDVYVATSMRERHEYFLVNGFCKSMFSRPAIVPLNLRYFDPTQAYCSDRLDKGLVEGLMLKRAKCTIYHAQETDTLGKDSELATTLAQGKPVIAYVPQLGPAKRFTDEALALASTLYPELSRQQQIEKLLRLYDPDGAWQNNDIRGWLSGSTSFDESKALTLLYERAKAKYDSRAKTLSQDHPLGLQMNLATGVANGVLVVRSVDQCAELLRRVMLNEMEFSLDKVKSDGKMTLVLREKITGCVYRAMTGDDLLTNSFWNFYLKEGPCQGTHPPQDASIGQLRLKLDQESEK